MDLKRSHEPVVWLLFGAGGMVAALLLPSVLAVILVGSVFSIDALNYDAIWQLSRSGLGRLVWLLLITLPVWHAMHRLFHLTHDLQWGHSQLFRILSYGGALLVTVSVVTLVLAVPS